MKRYIILAALTLAGCSDATLNTITSDVNAYNHSVDNFNAAAAAIDTSIAKTSDSLYKYCTAAKSAGTGLAPLAQNNTTARTGLATVTQGLTTWCDAPPNDVATAISSMAAVVASAKAAYDAAKSGK